jgi:hypothetical protein
MVAMVAKSAAPCIVNRRLSSNRLGQRTVDNQIGAGDATGHRARDKHYTRRDFLRRSHSRGGIQRHRHLVQIWRAFLGILPDAAPLLILDWDITQIEGALLETWLPMVFERLEELSRQCGTRHGSLGAMIEDKNSGTILLQQARHRGMRAEAIESKLTAMGKDERALSVSGYVYRGNHHQT